MHPFAKCLQYRIYQFALWDVMPNTPLCCACRCCREGDAAADAVYLLDFAV